MAHAAIFFKVIRSGSALHWALRALVAVGLVLLVWWMVKGAKPSSLGNYTDAMALAIAALSLNLLFGYIGELSMATAAFFGIGAYTAAILSMPPADSVFVPRAKTVERVLGAWLGNYSLHPWTVAAPVAAFGGAVLALVASALRRLGMALVSSSIAVAGAKLSTTPPAATLS